MPHTQMGMIFSLIQKRMYSTLDGLVRFWLDILGSVISQDIIDKGGMLTVA